MVVAVAHHHGFGVLNHGLKKLFIDAGVDVDPLNSDTDLKSRSEMR